MRRKELHRLIGEALEKIGRPEEVSGRLSFHFYEAGVTKKCVDYSLSTGEVCLRKGAGREALSYFDRIIEISADDPSLISQRLSALEGRGDGSNLVGMWESAGVAYKTYLQHATNPKDKARVAWKLADSYSDQHSNLPEALDLLKRAEESGEIDSIEKGRIIRTRADVLSTASWMNLAEADKLYGEAEKLFEVHGAAEDHAISLSQHFSLLLTLERFDEAYDMVSKAAPLFLSLGTPYWDQWALYAQGVRGAYIGQYDLALKDFSKTLEIALRVGNYEGGSVFHSWRARIFYLTDDFESARREALAGIEFASRQEGRIDVSLLKCLLALSEIRLGIRDEARKHLTEILEFLERVEKASGRDVMQRIATYTWSTLAEAEAATGESDRNRSNAKYLASLETFNEFNPAWKPVVLTRFAEALMKQGDYRKAKDHFLKAAEAYSKIGNGYQFERLSRLAAGLNGTD